MSTEPHTHRRPAPAATPTVPHEGRGARQPGESPASPGSAGDGPAPDAAAPAKPRRSRIPFIVAGVVVLVLAVFGVRKWTFARHHVSTDDAQIQGDIIPVLPRVSGFVAQVRVRENQSVRAGETLIVLDDRDLRAKLAQSEAELADAETAVRSSGRDGLAVAQLAAAQAQVREAEAAAWKARTDLERMRNLVDVVSRQDLDAAEATSRQADAHLAALRQQARASAAGVSSALAHVESARAARDQDALQLSYTQLVAPASGVVGHKDVEVGELVQVGQPLMSVVPLEGVWVVANLKETEVQHVSPGEHVSIKVDSYPGRTFRGTVESLSPASGARFSLLPPDNATGNYTKVVQRIPVRIRIDAAQDPQHLLRPGMSVNVVITTA